MLYLIKVFWDICRLRAGPQDLPKGVYLLVLAMFAGIIVDSFATSIIIPTLSTSDIVLTVASYNVLLLVAVYFLLKLIGYAERGLQTLTALVGSGLFISLVLLPSLLMMSSTEEQAKSLALFIMIDNIWRIAVNAHIFRHALSINILMAMVISVSYLLFSVLVAEILLPVSDQ